MTYVLLVFAAGALVSWLVALVSGIRMFGMLSGRLSAGAMLFRGIEWFNAANFRPEAAPLRRMFGRAFAAFFACILAVMVLSVVVARPG
jgi:ABC-type polysaccharide/polyol phosphate export permease